MTCLSAFRRLCPNVTATTGPDGVREIVRERCWVDVDGSVCFLRGYCFSKVDGCVK